MSEQRTYDAMHTATLALQVDTGRSATDDFKFTAGFRALGTTRLGECQAANSAAENMAADTSGAATLIGTATSRLGELARNVFNGVHAIDSETLPAPARKTVFELFLFPGGILGDLESHERVLNITRKVSEVAATPPPGFPAAATPAAATVSRINNWLAIYDANVLIANGGDRETLIETRNQKRDAMEAWNGRARFFYCSASDKGEYTKELKKIDLQPKRMPGDAQSEPTPDAAGTATYDPAARTLSVAALPAHATSLIAFRQPAGGTPVEAGVSNGTTVSAVSYGPMLPGVTYTLWVQGNNSRGRGPKSNVITAVG